MASTALTSGAIARYENGTAQPPAIIKVLSIRACEPSASTGTDEKRYRLSITDGQETFNACILSPDLNTLIEEKRLCDNSIVQLEKVVHNRTSTGKSFLTILDLTIQHQSTTPKQSNTSICPIGMITPYLNGIWKIRARCFAKSVIRPHPVCDFDFVDASGEIRIVAFRDDCARYHSTIEIDRVYDIMGVRVKTADHRWNKLRHTYELTFTPASIVRLIDDPMVDVAVPDIHFEFIPLRDLSKHSNEDFIDVIGIVEKCSDAVPFTNRTSNRDSKRREITLIDEETSASITLWDEQAENFDEDLAENHAVIAFQRARVAIYNNKYSLSGHKNMIMKINPDLLKAKHLRIWFDAGGRLPDKQTTASNTRPPAENSWKTIRQIEDEGLGRQHRADFVTIKAMCMHIANDRVVYMSCPTRDCSRKVNKISTDLYRCDRCQKNFKECQWTYILRAELVDSTGAIWVSFFRDQGEELMGNVTAEQFAQAKEDNDATLMQSYLNRNTFREKIFRLRVHEETYNDVTLVKMTCLSISDIDFSDYGRRLIEEMNIQF